MYLLRSSATSVAVCTREIRTFTKSKSDTPTKERERESISRYVRSWLSNLKIHNYFVRVCVCVCACVEFLRDEMEIVKQMFWT